MPYYCNMYVLYVPGNRYRYLSTLCTRYSTRVPVHVSTRVHVYYTCTGSYCKTTKAVLSTYQYSSTVYHICTRVCVGVGVFEYRYTCTRVPVPVHVHGRVHTWTRVRTREHTCTRGGIAILQYTCTIPRRTGTRVWPYEYCKTCLWHTGRLWTPPTIKK